MEAFRLDLNCCISSLNIAATPHRPDRLNKSHLSRLRQHSNILDKFVVQSHGFKCGCRSATHLGFLPLSMYETSLTRRAFLGQQILSGCIQHPLNFIFYIPFVFSFLQCVCGLLLSSFEVLSFVARIDLPQMLSYFLF